MNVTQHRTQLYLDQERYRWLKMNASRQGSTLAQAIRDAIDMARHREAQNEKKRKDQIHKMIQQLIGAGKHGPSDVSVRHDDYLGEALYEEIKRNRV